jgi:hypothetical protein
MSFKDFDRGLTAREVQDKKLAEKEEDHAMEQLRKWKESEHILNLLRTIKASQEAFTRLEMEQWRKATSGKL